MGSQQTTSTQQQRVEPTEEESELNRLALERVRASQGGQIQVQESGLNLINQLLTGGELPGALSQLTGGISEEALQTQAERAARVSAEQFQGLGIVDSGVAFRETSRDIASNLLFPAEQFNIQNLQQLLNQALGGQAQVQAPLLGQQQNLGNRLTGLRNINTTQSVISPNPFLSSFQTSLGESLGGGTFGGFTAFDN